MEKIVLCTDKKAEDTLYIIGNGFDLAHGMKTSYENFHQWLLDIDNGHNSAVYRLETLYPNIKNTNGRWCDIESALGSVTMEEAVEFDRYFQEYSDEDSDEDSSYDNYQCGGNIKNVVDTLPFLLRQWIASINTDGVTILFDLWKDAKFLSFNYTRTLENIYGVDNNSVLHIHETIIGNRPLVVGYGEAIFESENYSSDNEEENTTRIKNILSHCRKPVMEILEEPKPKNWLKGLSNISAVIVYGHSCSNVDKPYFEKVANCIKEDAHWTFYVYDSSKNSAIEKFAKSVIKEKQQFEIINQ